MAISRTRRNFRKVLGGLLILSLLFFSTSVYFYVNIKNKTIKVSEISQTLFEIDILQHRFKMAFSDQDGQFKIAEKMIRNSFFSPIYGKAGLEMLDDLSKAGHAASQTYHADLILLYRLKHPKEAETLYRAAAAQGYLPAEQKLAALDLAP